MKVARFIGFLLVWVVVSVVASVVRNKLFPPTDGPIGAFNLDWRNLPGFILGFLVGVQSLRRSWPWLAWTVTVIVLAFCCVVWQVVQRNAYSNEGYRIWNTLNTTLREKRPQNISQEEWDASVGWTLTAHINVFFSPDHASLQSLNEFGKKLDDKLKDEVDPSIFDWIWYQYEQTGPSGKQYVCRFRSAAFPDTKQAIQKQQEK